MSVNQERGPRGGDRLIAAAVVSLLLVGAAAAYYTAYGSSINGFPAPVPWVAVWNYGPAAVTVQLWDGGRIFVADCGVKQGFPADADVQWPPPAPWHIQIRDARGAKVLADTRVWGFDAWRLAYVHHDGAVTLSAMSERGGSWDGPASCAP